MKKFVFKSLIFILILIVVDVCVGPSIEFFRTRATGGYTNRINYIMNELDSEFLLFGSSRAIHHYDPQMIEDSLGLSSYNCGLDGNGIIFNYAQYLSLSKRYSPKVIVYDISTSFDIYEGDDNVRYLGHLRPFYDYPGIDSIFWNVNSTERIKMISKMYRNNTKFLGYLADYFHPFYSSNKGYILLEGEMKYDPNETQKIVKVEDKPEPKVDAMKFYYMQRLIDDCKKSGTTLIFAVSPLYGATSADVYQPIIELAQKNGIPFINHYNDTTFTTKREYFKDTSHMNRTGATVYTELFIKELREMIGAK